VLELQDILLKKIDLLLKTLDTRVSRALLVCLYRQHGLVLQIAVAIGLVLYALVVDLAYYKARTYMVFPEVGQQLLVLLENNSLTDLVPALLLHVFNKLPVVEEEGLHREAGLTTALLYDVEAL